MIILTTTEFCDFGPATVQFDALFENCLRNRQTLILEISAKDTRIYARKKDSATDSHAVVEASLVYDFILPVESGVAMKLLVPLIAPIVGIVLPTQQIYSVRKGKRSIADFFMRNLFFAICRNKDVLFSAAVGGLKVPPAHVNLAKRYLWILQPALKDKVLHEKNLFEMLILNTHLPVLDFENRLLSRGAEELRIRMSIPAESRQSVITNFDRIRSEVMGILP